MKARLLVLIAALAPLAAPAAEFLGNHRPSLESVELLRQTSYPAFAVGEFVPAPNTSGTMKTVQIRFSARTALAGQSFASYLKASIVSELAAAGKYDPTSATVISGELTESRLDGGGGASLAARIVVVRSGQTIYDKVLREESQWESAFLGEIAITDGFNQYAALYGKLIMQLFKDEAFKAAIAVALLVVETEPSRPEQRQGDGRE
jgi:hypothetical protein